MRKRKIEGYLLEEDGLSCFVFDTKRGEKCEPSKSEREEVKQHRASTGFTKVKVVRCQKSDKDDDAAKREKVLEWRKKIANDLNEIQELLHMSDIVIAIDGVYHRLPVETIDIAYKRSGGNGNREMF